ncbi:zinc finger CCCH domain-containing protein 3-like [Chenopodium quinoa]|uniref:zinc finger CCCH domain-containing protein 3-like n=1 Tax=Chenopodium quinoa TaxID=63459 RepID=UPI000B795A21|nr:zinc finger CCCH domain-containing protein 3-like [Chenopodium quinoa]XP_021772479.1 zinc finger CCCH domain-containing protein 3-like [Chenopodium quinoa]
MTVGKYYCDYCDKEFKDTASARRRHLQGIAHHRNRKLWYDSLSLPQDPNFTQQSFGNGVCNRFLRTGFCPYGDSCKYHHPKHNLQGPITQGQGTPSFAENLQPHVGGLQGHVASQSFGMSLGNLPPSLRPPPEGGYPPLPFVDWE